MHKFIPIFYKDNRYNLRKANYLKIYKKCVYIHKNL